MKRLLFNLTLNTRDIGGYIGKDNKPLKYGRFIRSDALRYIDDKDKDYLLNNNVLTQIDLRTEGVIYKIPSALEKDSRFNYLNIPLKEGSLKSLEAHPDIPTLYMKMVGNTEAFYKIFKTLINTKGGIIINCTAGKDRTGIVIYMLLSLFGVKLVDIKKDYLYSQTCIEEMLPKIRKVQPDFPEFLGYAKEEYFDTFVELFTKKYQSVENYLLGIGIKQEELDSLIESMS